MNTNVCSLDTLVLFVRFVRKSHVPELISGICSHLNISSSRETRVQRIGILPACNKETFCVGNVDEDGEKLVRTAFDCLSSALALVKPGTLYRELGSAIHKTAASNGCSVVRTYCGHGIGSLFHVGILSVSG